MGKIILAFAFTIFFSANTNAEEASSGRLVKGEPNRNANCPRTKRTVCKTPQGNCETIYLNEVDSDECREENNSHLKDVCETTTPKFFKDEKACMALPENKSCPKDTNGFDSKNKDYLATCSKLHSKVCTEACGVSYTGVDVRKDFTTSRNSLICIDGKINNDRGKCNEVHVGGGVRYWCIQFDLDYKGIDWGRDLQCVGKIDGN